MSDDKVIIKRLPTGVPGLDVVLGGGLPEFSFNLIAGAPGSGKTTLAHQIMFNLATEQRPALYFTVLGEPPIKMLRYQQQFSFFDTQQISRAVYFISLSDEIATGDLGRVLARISREVEEHSPGFIFVDSFRSVILASQTKDGSPLNLQQFVQQLGMLLTSWQATTFLLGEYLAEAEPSPVFTIADGLIWLRQSVERNSMVRKMEVMKMRGQATQPGLHTFRISSHGLDVFCAPQLSATRPPTHEFERITMGVAGLDEMMGGGVPRGYSVLVAGPSGSGKSLLAAAFLVEGARKGENGVIVAFEQRPNRSRGKRISALIEEGRLGVVDTTSPGISVDEIASLLIAEVGRLKATRVVIDSLSGFELALAPTFRADFRESLSRLVVALAGTGATVLMTSELEDRYEELRFSPYGTAFLTDSIIVQRYIEVESRLRRVMAVVKVRASMHSNELRLFTINDEGIQLGSKLEAYEGLLGGRPTHRGTG
jgi:circadian clock protein KaiC